MGTAERAALSLLWACIGLAGLAHLAMDRARWVAAERIRGIGAARDTGHLLERRSQKFGDFTVWNSEVQLPLFRPSYA